MCLFYLDYGTASSAEPSAAGSEGSSEGVAEEVEEEEEETCGFCIFMKAGGCKDAFNVRYTDQLRLQ